jgi:hypothetical protein
MLVHGTKWRVCHTTGTTSGPLVWDQSCFILSNPKKLTMAPYSYSTYVYSRAREPTGGLKHDAFSAGTYDTRLPVASMVHVTKVGARLMGRQSLTSASQFMACHRHYTWTSTTMSLPKKSFLSNAMGERAHSASPQPHAKPKFRSVSNPDAPVRTSSVQPLPNLSNPLPPSVSTSTQTTLESPPILDATETLLRATPAVVKARTGSVLARGFILKTDYYPDGTSLTTQYSLMLIVRCR